MIQLIIMIKRKGKGKNNIFWFYLLIIDEGRMNEMKRNETKCNES